MDSDILSNADMRPADVRRRCKVDEAGQSLMKSALNQMKLSARAYQRVLKLALVKVEFLLNAATINGHGLHPYNSSNPTLTDATFSVTPLIIWC
jgi:predicted ATPase with chaperone activity